jgi:hypothetical protein
MSKGKRSIRPEIIFIAAFLFYVVMALLLDWWKTHAVIGWSLSGAFLVGLVYALYRFPRFRNWAFQTGKRTAGKIVYKEIVPGREPVPHGLYIKTLNRANNRCQNPECGYHGKPHVHHINQNNRDNSLANLIALCPNCHNDAHDGKYQFSQLRNWLKMNQLELQPRLPML